jgi:hypothetical protein
MMVNNIKIMTIMDLTKKHYENLVEALTNNVMNAAANSSYNLTSSLPKSSSSTFPNLSNENDIYRIKESETYHNSKGDIAEIQQLLLLIS